MRATKARGQTVLNPRACVASRESDWVLTIIGHCDETPAMGNEKKCEEIVNKLQTFFTFKSCDLYFRCYCKPFLTKRKSDCKNTFTAVEAGNK